jgi:hypothetical protein
VITRPLKLALIMIGLVLIIAGTLKGGTLFNGRELGQSMWGNLASEHPGYASGIVLVEMLVGLSLVLPRTRPWQILLAVSLFSTFAALLGVEATRDTPRPCGCFGHGGSDPVARDDLVIAAIGNLTVSIGLALAAMVAAVRRRIPDAGPPMLPSVS